MDSLQEILGKKDFTPPDELQLVRDYIKRRYDSSCRLKLQRDALIISVKGSALAATLQFEQDKIIQSCGLKKRLVIRYF